MSVDQYSQNPASNDLSGYFATGMRPSAVKNAGWDVMADLAMQMGPGSLPTTGGTANAQTITNTRQVGALYAGLRFRVLPSATNTGAMTFAPDGLAAKNVFANGVAAIAGMWVQNVPADIIYDGTQWNLINPQRSTGSFTGTLTGVSGSVTQTILYAIGIDGKSVDAWTNSVFSGTGSTTACTITGAPAIIRPASTRQGSSCKGLDGGTGCLVSFEIDSASGTWTLGKNGVDSGWTASATKGFNTSTNWLFTHYTLDT